VQVLASDLLEDRRALGRRMGALVFDTDAVLDAALREATDGRAPTS